VHVWSLCEHMFNMTSFDLFFSLFAVCGREPVLRSSVSPSRATLPCVGADLCFPTNISRVVADTTTRLMEDFISACC
jgi:hypothetical protein